MFLYKYLLFEFGITSKHAVHSSSGGFPHRRSFWSWICACSSGCSCPNQLWKSFTTTATATSTCLRQENINIDCKYAFETGQNIQTDIFIVKKYLRIGIREIFYFVTKSDIRLGGTLFCFTKMAIYFGVAFFCDIYKWNF